MAVAIVVELQWSAPRIRASRREIAPTERTSAARAGPQIVHFDVRTHHNRADRMLLTESKFFPDWILVWPELSREVSLIIGTVHCPVRRRNQTHGFDQFNLHRRK